MRETIYLSVGGCRYSLDNDQFEFLLWRPCIIADLRAKALQQPADGREFHLGTARFPSSIMLTAVV